MRNITDVINEVLEILPDPPPTEVADDITVLKAELRILKRTGSYTPAEAHTDEALWDRLGIALYRYMPNPEGYTWAKAISDVMKAGTP